MSGLSIGNKRMIRKKLSVMVSAAAIAAVMFTPSEASANGWVEYGTPCPGGRACAVDWSTFPDRIWIADGCGFHNMGNQWFSDQTDAYRTDGNAIQFGDYQGWGDTTKWVNYIHRSPIYPAHSARNVDKQNKYDAMFVFC
jgi:hypothetical protein